MIDIATTDGLDTEEATKITATNKTPFSDTFADEINSPTGSKFSRYSNTVRCDSITLNSINIILIRFQYDFQTTPRLLTPP